MKHRRDKTTQPEPRLWQDAAGHKLNNIHQEPIDLRVFWGELFLDSHQIEADTTQARNPNDATRVKGTPEALEILLNRVLAQHAKEAPQERCVIGVGSRKIPLLIHYNPPNPECDAQAPQKVQELQLQCCWHQNGSWSQLLRIQLWRSSNESLWKIEEIEQKHHHGKRYVTLAMQALCHPEHSQELRHPQSNLNRVEVIDSQKYDRETSEISVQQWRYVEAEESNREVAWFVSQGRKEEIPKYHAWYHEDPDHQNWPIRFGQKKGSPDDGILDNTLPLVVLNQAQDECHTVSCSPIPLTLHLWAKAKILKGNHFLDYWPLGVDEMEWVRELQRAFQEHSMVLVQLNDELQFWVKSTHWTPFFIEQAQSWVQRQSLQQELINHASDSDETLASRSQPPKKL